MRCNHAYGNSFCGDIILDSFNKAIKGRKQHLRPNIYKQLFLWWFWFFLIIHENSYTTVALHKTPRIFAFPTFGPLSSSLYDLLKLYQDDISTKTVPIWLHQTVELLLFRVSDGGVLHPSDHHLPTHHLGLLQGTLPNTEHSNIEWYSDIFPFLKVSTNLNSWSGASVAGGYSRLRVPIPANQKWAYGTPWNPWHWLYV